MKNFNLFDIQPLITNQPDPTGDQFLDTRYEEQISIVGHPQPYYRLFYQITQMIKPGLVVELGGWQGTAAAHFAGGGAGTVVSIDHHGDPGDDQNKIKMLAAAQYFPNMFYFQGWTWDKLADVKALDKSIDILFIDSWHEYQYAKRDWDDYSPLLSDIALVIVDDIFEDPVTIKGIMKFWDEISSGYDAFTHGTPHWGIPMGFMKYEKR